MKFLVVLFLSSLLISCNKVNGEMEHISVLSVTDAQNNDVSFLDSIRVVPLETLDSALISTPNLFQYVPEIGKYLIMDNQQIVFVYDKNGKFLSSSMSCRGDGSRQYQVGVDALYNPYEEVFEILDPTRGGIIYQYDLDFDFVGLKKMNRGEDFIVHSFSLIDEDVYSFVPVRFDDNVYIEIMNSSEDKHPVFDKIFCQKDKYVSEVNMMQKDFFLTDTMLYYSPCYMDYHFYSFDLQNKTINPIIKLNLGDDMLEANDLEDMFGAFSGNKYSNLDNLQKRNEYLLSSNYMLPIIRLINDKFVYVHCIKNRKPFHLIYNRISGKKYWITKEAEILLNRCFSLQNNVLYSFVRAHELEKYINESHFKYMSKDNIEILDKVEEEDNPVVIEYHLHEE